MILVSYCGDILVRISGDFANRERQNSHVGPSIRLTSGNLEGLTDHIRILHTGCLLGAFDLDVRLFFLIFAPKRPAPGPGPADEEMKKKNQVFYRDW